MHPSNSTWTWTVIKTSIDNEVHYLPRSPEGNLLLPKSLAGKFFTIVADDVDRGCSAKPDGLALGEGHLFMQVQLSPEIFTVAYMRSDGEPQLPEPFRDLWHAVQKRDRSWCFLPKSETVVPENWYQKHYGKQPSQALLQELQTAQKTQQTRANAEVAKNGEKPKAFTDALTQNHGKGARTEARTSGNSSNPQLPNYQVTQLPNAPPPNPASMMDNIENLIRQHLICTSHQSAVLALWILHTYTYRASHLTPYLNISSRVEESGKSTCMTILRSLCARPWWAAGASRSAFTRKIIADQPTVLLDNWQTVFSSSDKTQITGFLLTGCDQPPTWIRPPQIPITQLPTYPITRCLSAPRPSPVPTRCPRVSPAVPYPSSSSAANPTRPFNRFSNYRSEEPLKSSLRGCRNGPVLTRNKLRQPSKIGGCGSV